MSETYENNNLVFYYIDEDLSWSVQAAVDQSTNSITYIQLSIYAEAEADFD
jgi:hypothetical protein